MRLGSLILSLQIKIHYIEICLPEQGPNLVLEKKSLRLPSIVLPPRSIYRLEARAKEKKTSPVRKQATPRIPPQTPLSGI